MILASVIALTICGALHEVGSEGATYTVIEPSKGDGTSAYLVPSEIAHTLSTWNASVCLTGPIRSTTTPGARGEIDVKSYRLVGDGKHGPITGRISSIRGHWEVTTDNRKRFPICQASHVQLSRYGGRHVWLLARWQTCGMDVTALDSLE